MTEKIKCGRFGVTFNYKIVNNLLRTSVTGKGFSRKELYRIAIHHNYDCGIDTDNSTSMIINPRTNKIERCDDAKALKGDYYSHWSEDEQTVQIFEKIK